MRVEQSRTTWHLRQLRSLSELPKALPRLLLGPSNFGVLRSVC
jgi:hypothetical protein